VRFDPAYYGLFRTNLRRLGVRETVDLDHIKRG
jgi:hypothetical protein